MVYIDDGCPGYITHYYSWRMVHGILCLVGLIGFTTFFFLFPETSHPGARGIEKINASTAFIVINPLESLWLLRSPSMLLTVRILQPNMEKITDSKHQKGIIIAASQMAGLGEIPH
jgi:hypothetical protein